MMKKEFIPILILLFVAGNNQAQFRDFDLSNYKLPDLEWRLLETSFNLAGLNRYERRPESEYPGISEYGYNDFSGDLAMDYYHYLNNAKSQRESWAGFSFSGYLQGRKNDNVLYNRYGNFSPLVYYQRDCRRYFGSNKFFLGSDLYFSYRFEKNKGFNEYGGYEYRDNLQMHHAVARVPLSIGIGRIEQVQDARHAIYLLSELSKVERVTSDKSDQDIIRFAELISRLKNERFFDSRLRNIEEIKAVDSFLVANDYVLNSDATYFTTLSDFWRYGNYPVRESGTRFAYVIAPEYNFERYNNPDDGYLYDHGKYNLHAFSGTSGFELLHEKPINIFFQNSMILSAYATFTEGRLNDKITPDESKIRAPGFRTRFSQMLGYYPNTRTYLRFRYSVEYRHFFDQTDPEKGITGVDGKGAMASADFNLYFYISPQVRLNVSTYLSGIWQASEDQFNVYGSVLDYFTNPGATANGFREWIIDRGFNIGFSWFIF